MRRTRKWSTRLIAVELTDRDHPGRIPEPARPPATFARSTGSVLVGEVAVVWKQALAQLAPARRRWGGIVLLMLLHHPDIPSPQLGIDLLRHTSSFPTQKEAAGNPWRFSCDDPLNWAIRPSAVPTGSPRSARGRLWVAWRLLKQSMAEPMIGLFKTELIRRGGPWNGLNAIRAR